MQTRRQFLAGSVATALAGPVLVRPVLGGYDTDWAQKMFEKSSHDFGVVARGADTTYRLKLKNIYKETVHIAEVRTTCGCSAGQPSQETLKSLEEAYVEITMDTRKFMRRKDSNVIVVFDQPLYQQVQIPITAYIRTDVVVEPGSVQFGAVDREELGAKTLKVNYAGRDSWQILEVKSGSEHLTATAKETARGSGRVEYDLIVTLNGSVPFGQFRQTLTLVTNDENSSTVPILVEADVKPDIVVNPAVVALGTMEPGQTRTFNVVLRGKKPFEVTSVTCLKAKDVFQVRLPQTAAAVQVIPLTVTAPATPGTLDEELRVDIPGRAEPVTFRAYGRIIGNESAEALEARR